MDLLDSAKEQMRSAGAAKFPELGESVESESSSGISPHDTTFQLIQKTHDKFMRCVLPVKEKETEEVEGTPEALKIKNGKDAQNM
jgi:hypothetical protein